MSKADQSGKRDNGTETGGSKKEEESLKWTARDALTFGFLAAIAAAKGQEEGEDMVFSDRLKTALLADSDLRTLVRLYPHKAKQAISDLPCGQKVVKEFLFEVQSKGEKPKKKRPSRHRQQKTL